MPPLDILAIAPHPDDAELGVGGILARHARDGGRVGVLELTRGEMSTNGTPEERFEEARAAARILGLAWRGNLELPDSALEVTGEYALAVAAVLRMVRPALLLAPDHGDRHPDHRAAADLAERGAFLASLGRSRVPGQPLPVPKIGHYPINDLMTAAVVVDVSDVYDVKRRAIRAHTSQFDPDGRRPTVLNDPSFLAMIESRDALFGSRTGVRFGEGISFEDPIRLSDLSAILARRPGQRG